MNWCKTQGRYACGETLFLGDKEVGYVHYDSCVPKGSECFWVASCSLATRNVKFKHHATMGLAKIELAAFVKSWINDAGLREKGA